MGAIVTGALGQAAPAAGVLTTVYSVPAARRASVRVLVCNRANADSFRVAVATNDAADATMQYLAYDEPLAAHDSVASIVLGLGSLDVVRCSSASGNVSFTVTGFEQDE